MSTNENSRLTKLEKAMPRPGGGPRSRAASVPITVPNIIEFITSKDYLNRPTLYPRQATLLKIATLSVELLTDYDLQVIAEWESGFELVDQDGWSGYEGKTGLPPGTIERMIACRESGRLWFHEVVLVMGRRAGKGHLSALLTCYLLWHLLALDNPQRHFDIELTKQLVVMTMASEMTQASETVHRDVVKIISTAPCFADYLGKSGTGLRLRTPADLAASAEPEGSIVVEPRATTASSGRGSASVGFLFDEMAWAPADGQSRGADEVYRASTPALSQFTSHSLCILASSPASQTGQFYESYRQALQVTDGVPAFPDTMVVQLPSWGPYVDWELTRDGLAMWPGGPDFAVRENPPIREDSQVVRAARASNWNAYLVEYEARWRSSQYSYLDPDLVAEMFSGWQGKQLHQQHNGVLAHSYVMHCDPSTSGANFGVVVGHREGDQQVGHIVIDYLHAFEPAQFDGGRIDYLEVQETVWALIQNFKPARISFDQFNSEQMIQTLNARLRDTGRPDIMAVTRAATAKINWMDAERFKTLLGQHRIHAPQHLLARDELLFLEQKGMKVDHPSSGPVKTSDIADCLFNITAHLMDGSIETANQLASAQLTGGLAHGTPHPAFSQFAAERRRGSQAPNLARGLHQRRR